MKILNYTELDERYLGLHNRVLNSIHNNNALLSEYFQELVKVSDILPSYINQITILSDMVTDAMVVSGRSSLSTTLNLLPIVSNDSIEYSSETNSIKLETVDEINYQLSNANSRILSSNLYTIFDKDKNTISSFKGALNNSGGIVIRSEERAFKYTLSLELPSKVLVNRLDFDLSLTTDSYPLISEVYYIDDNSRKINCFFTDHLSNSFDTDANRVKGNEYKLNINPVSVKRLYVTLEDIDKVDLAIKSLSVKKVKYKSAGSIVFGPIISTYPILKASIEATKTSEAVKFYLSQNTTDWSEVILPQDIDTDTESNKTISFNTVNKKSIKTAKDITSLYVRIDLQSETSKDFNPTLYRLARESFTQAYLAINSNLVLRNYSVFKKTKQLSYGSAKRYTTYDSNSILDPQVSHIRYGNTLRVKGFTDTAVSVSSDSNTSYTQTTAHSLPLKSGVFEVDSSRLDPYSATLYGYAINKQALGKEINTDTNEVVIKLKDEYKRGIYSIRQGNKEIKVDLSLGYIESAITVVVTVESGKKVELYDEVGTKVKELQTFTEDTFSYVSLISDGLFEVPEIEGKSFNPTYPLTLNDEDHFSVLEKKLISNTKIEKVTNIFRLTTEVIETIPTVSKENKSYISSTEESTVSRYTKSNNASIKAFTPSRAIKLPNKNIKKQSLKVVRKDEQ